MISVSVSEAKDRLPELLRKVEAGERVTITRHGKPVGEIAAPQTPKNTFSFERIRRDIEAAGYAANGSRIPDDFDEIDVWGDALDQPIFPE